MSWDPYIDNLVESCRDSSGLYHCDKVCIIGMEGGVCWTSGKHPQALRIKQDEAKQLAQVMRSRDTSQFQKNGILVAGERYIMLRNVDDKIVYAKKKGIGGITIHSTKSAIIVAHCAEGRQQGNVNKGTGRMADYLESVNM